MVVVAGDGVGWGRRSDGRRKGARGVGKRGGVFVTLSSSTG